MWPIAISIIFNVVYLKGDTLLLSIFTNQTEVGIYGAAYRVLDVLTQTAMMIMGLFLPLLAFSWGQNLKQEFKERLKQLLEEEKYNTVGTREYTLVEMKPLFISND